MHANSHKHTDIYCKNIYRRVYIQTIHSWFICMYNFENIHVYVWIFFESIFMYLWEHACMYYLTKKFFFFVIQNKDDECSSPGCRMWRHRITETPGLNKEKMQLHVRQLCTYHLQLRAFVCMITCRLYCITFINLMQGLERCIRCSVSKNAITHVSLTAIMHCWSDEEKTRTFLFT